MNMVIGISVLVTVFGLAIWGLWHLSKNSINIYQEFDKLKKDAEKAETKKELEEVYEKFKEVHKTCWHKYHGQEALLIHTYIHTKFNYMDETPSKVLSMRQVQSILNFYDNHKEMVDKMMGETEKLYPPSQSEDKNDPSIWKPEYWNWFFMFNEKK